jgi:uncharacterized protein (DUF486 family)
MRVLIFVISMILFLASWYVMAQAFNNPGYEALIFSVGILLFTVSIMIPFMARGRRRS